MKVVWLLHLQNLVVALNLVQNSFLTELMRRHILLVLAPGLLRGHSNLQLTVSNIQALLEAEPAQRIAHLINIDRNQLSNKGKKLLCG